MSSYHHGNLRASLIEAGVDLARTDGAAGVVIREVARRTGVSHNAAYRHFADREALLAEVAAVGMGRLALAMQGELDGVSEDLAARDRGDARLRAVGRAYVEFAVAEPGLFQVAFSTDAADLAGGAGGVNPYDLLTQVLDEGTLTGTVAAERRPGAEVVCWSAVHGFAALHVSGPMAASSPAERREALEVMLDHVARGLA